MKSPHMCARAPEAPRRYPRVCERISKRIAPSTSGATRQLCKFQLVIIFSDARLNDAAARLLREGVEAHEIIFPQKPASSVLARSEPDPGFARADVAFGQPELASI